MISRGNLALLALLLFAVVSPGTAIKSGTVRITVLDSQSQSLPTGENDVPRDCDPTNYSAYCHSSKSAEIINTLVVQIGSEPPFRVTCTVETRWSRCIPLPKGETFDARKEKRGVLIYYEDDSGKPRSQLYTYVADEAKNAPLQPVPAAETQPAPVPAENPAPASPAAPGSTPAGVQCSFTSTPAGAEITVDGRYVGSTPSLLNLNAGEHSVIVSLPGYTDWTRHLDVSPGSALTVNAALKKSQ